MNGASYDASTNAILDERRAFGTTSNQRLLRVQTAFQILSSSPRLSTHPLDGILLLACTPELLPFIKKKTTHVLRFSVLQDVKKLDK